MRSIQILQHQIGLWFRDGDFHDVLDPGRHRILDPRFWRHEVELHRTSQLSFTHSRLELLAREPAIRKRALVLDLAEDQRALVWRRGRLEAFVGPGLHAWWNTREELEAEMYDVSAPRFEHRRLNAILAHPAANKWLNSVEISEHEQGLLFRDGRLVERLSPGRHVFWLGAGNLAWKSVDLREQIEEITGQEIMTRDKVSLRVNLSLGYRITNAEKAVRAAKDWSVSLYRAAQLALRGALGTRRLDDVLAEKDAVGEEVLGGLRARAAELGIEVQSAGLRDLILPGEMKALLNQVVEAEKQAQANLIRRREETAAARSQANTARLMADNPILARMKQLEQVQDILSDTRATFVFGSGEISRELLGLVGSEENGKPENGKSS